VSRIRVIVFITFGIVLTIAFAPAASATPPVREPVESPPIEFAAGEVCGFPVRLEATVNKGKATTFSDGRTRFTGSFRTLVTNLSTGESLELNTPGPVLITPTPTTLVVRGSGATLFFFFPDDLGPGEPGALLYVRGQLRETLNAEGTELVGPVTITGRVENICDTLAS
jgi:hypothetical protein